jgi:hypothetical protein
MNKDNEDRGYCSSGLSSDEDMDLMLEQEMIKDKKKFRPRVPPAEDSKEALEN